MGSTGVGELHIIRIDVPGQLADPSGVQTRGLQNYKQFFGVIRMFRRVMIDKVDITFKLRYDWSSKIIKVTWYSKWYARGSSRRRTSMRRPLFIWTTRGRSSSTSWTASRSAGGR